MCGIVGFINLNKEPVNVKVINEMTDALAHRGPDGRGVYLDRFFALGHRRLSIIDLSLAANQPMKTEDAQFVISYNGELYNFKQLRKELIAQGISFFSQSDTEVVLKSFIHWGKDCLLRFNGMFAFAIWDKKNNTLFLARDRYGIKPLYLWQKDKTFLFASEIKAFLKHPLFKVKVDLSSLVEYFTFQNTLHYNTLFSEVRLLEPGHWLEISLENGGKQTKQQYWDFCFQEDLKMESFQECSDELDRLFTQAVKRQLISDVEIGAFLSGGIDSGSVTAVAAQQIKELKTFCIGFDLSSASGMELCFDERAKAEKISCVYKTEHYERVLKSGDMQRCMDRLVWSLEDLRLGQSYPNFYASKLASKFVKVCLSGAGGDELFAGYPWRYYKSLRANSFDEYIDGYYAYWQRLIPNRFFKDLFAPIWPQVQNVWTEDIFRSVFTGHEFLPRTPQDYINHSLYFEAKTFLHGLLLIDDKLSMAHSLELRVPFLDNDLVDFAMRVPIQMKLREIDNVLSIDEDEFAKQQKYFQRTQDGKLILRHVLKRYIGENILNQDKQGFSGPDASWFKGESINYVKEMLLNPKAELYNFFNYAAVKSLVEQHLEGDKNRRLFIWSLLCFQSWLEIFLKDIL